jgi:hypothetical protein
MEYIGKLDQLVSQHFEEGKLIKSVFWMDANNLGDEPRKITGEFHGNIPPEYFGQEIEYKKTSKNDAFTNTSEIVEEIRLTIIPLKSYIPRQISAKYSRRNE